MSSIPNEALGPLPGAQPSGTPVFTDEQRAARAKFGIFWDTDSPPEDPDDDYILASEVSSYADKSHLMRVSKAFLNELAEFSERASPLNLDGPISEGEWQNARVSQPPVIDRWFYEDVGCFIAPGGTGKTTLLLFQVIHIVLGWELFGHEVMNPGPVVMLTAEDSRETLVARLRQMAFQLQLTDEQIRSVREDVIITDVSGKGIKLTTVEKDVVMPSAQLDRLIVNIGVLNPSLVIIDPLVSFGVGESRVNDAEQGMIDAARRIRNAVKCGVIYVHHTGKANARDRTLDQYSGRGGSALADGSRMVHVLCRLTPDEWTESTGYMLEGDDAGFLLARPKMTWCPPQPDIYIMRRGFVFERFDHIGETAGAMRVNQIADDKVWQFLKDEYLKGIKHTQNSVEDAKVLPQKATRQAVKRLLKDQRLASEDLGTGGRGGARHFLRPMERA
jgi:regulatory protein RepA